MDKLRFSLPLVAPLLCALSFVLGAFYALHNTDPHHWGFIVGTALDFVHGKSFFNEIYIQYGVGQPLLFKGLSWGIPINETSVGFTTALIYAATLFILFSSLKKITSVANATLVVFAAFLMHTYAIYPWPDYYAGFFLACSCYFLLSNRPKRFFVAGVFLFFAFLFRNTYLLSTFAAAAGYGVVVLLNRRLRSLNIALALAAFSACLGVYFCFLAVQGKLALWYGQTIGAGTDQYKLGAESLLTLLKNVFLPPRIYLPNMLVNTSISALYDSALIFAVLLVFKKESCDRIGKFIHPGTAIFLALLGFAGMAQATLGYEPFRIQNSSSSLYLVLVLLILMMQAANPAAFRSKKFIVAVFIYFTLMAVKFPGASSIFPVFDGNLSEYTESKIEFYRWHRFRSEETKYYETLTSFLCDGHSKILNITMDSSVPYLCPGQENALSLPFYYEPMLSHFDAAKFQKVKTGDYELNELVVAECPIAISSDKKLVEIGRAERPDSTRFFRKASLVLYRVERK